MSRLSTLALVAGVALAVSLVLPAPDAAYAHFCTVKIRGEETPVSLNDIQPTDPDKITFCHRTGSESNPYVLITTDRSAVEKEGHCNHPPKDGRNDIFPDNFSCSP